MKIIEYPATSLVMDQPLSRGAAIASPSQRVATSMETLGLEEYLDVAHPVSKGSSSNRSVPANTFSPLTPTTFQEVLTPEPSEKKHRGRPFGAKDKKKRVSKSRYETE